MRIVLVHGWGGSTQTDWFPWAKKVLEDKGYEVVLPEMPNPDYPKIDSWTNKLKEVIGKVKSDDIFIGHSIGCQAIEIAKIKELVKNSDTVLLEGSDLCLSWFRRSASYGSC